MRHECHWCALEFTGQRNAKFCGQKCRNSNRRATSGVPQHTPRTNRSARDFSQHPLVVAVKTELAAAGRLETVGGGLAVKVALLMADPDSSGAGLVGLSKELTRTMTEALKGAPVAGQKLAVVRPVDELTVRRGARRQKLGYHK